MTAELKHFKAPVLCLGCWTTANAVYVRESLSGRTALCPECHQRDKDQTRRWRDWNDLERDFRERLDPFEARHVLENHLKSMAETGGDDG